jgi:hypothetical protein
MVRLQPAAQPAETGSTINSLVHLVVHRRHELAGSLQSSTTAQVVPSPITGGPLLSQGGRDGGCERAERGRNLHGSAAIAARHSAMRDAVSARPRTPSAGRPGGCARMPNAKQGLLLNHHAPTPRAISPSATHLPRPRWRRSTARCRSARDSSCCSCSMFQEAVQPAPALLPAAREPARDDGCRGPRHGRDESGVRVQPHPPQHIQPSLTLHGPVRAARTGA